MIEVFELTQPGEITIPGIGDIMDALCAGLCDIDGARVESSDCDNDSGEIYVSAIAEDRATGYSQRRDYIITVSES